MHFKEMYFKFVKMVTKQYKTKLVRHQLYWRS